MVLPLITFSSRVHSGWCLGCTLCALLLYVSNSDKLPCLGLSLHTGSYFMPHGPGGRKGGLEGKEEVWEEYEKEKKDEVEQKKGQELVSHVSIYVPGNQE